MADYYLDNTFEFSKRELVANNVVQKLKNKLSNLSVDYSYECGFNLPFYGSEWSDIDYGEPINSIIKYHDSRQLRFYSSESKIIDGLRYKDGIKYWSDNEIELIDGLGSKIQSSSWLLNKL